MSSSAVLRIRGSRSLSKEYTGERYDHCIRSTNLCLFFNSLFGNNSRFIGNCKTSTERSHAPSPSFPIGCHLRTRSTVSKPGKWHWCGVWVQFCVLLSYILYRHHHHSQNTELFHRPKDLPCATLYNHTPPPLPTIHNPWQPLICSTAL